MLVTIDVGNTHTVIGIYEADRLLNHWRLSTKAERTTDEHGVMIGALLQSVGLEPPLRPEGVAIACVVPPLNRTMEELAHRYFQREPLVVGPGIKTGMPIRMDNPRELGADRLVNAVAAFERVGGPCIVVDFGTAMTYDAISADGEYLGGIIAPGVEISMEALTERAAKLPKIELGEPRSLIGKSTLDAIRSGVIYGFAGQVDGIVTRLRDELGDDARTIATGGLAQLIIPFTDTIDEFDDLLTLTGLQLLHERNA
jgi:type III pantothenate kinase